MKSGEEVMLWTLFAASCCFTVSVVLYIVVQSSSKELMSCGFILDRNRPIRAIRMMDGHTWMTDQQKLGGLDKRRNRSG